MLWTLLALFVGVPAAVVLVLFLRQHGMIYYPRAYEAGEEERGTVALTFSTPDGRQTAYYLPPLDTTGSHAADRAAPADLWLLFGGNASLALDWLDFVLGIRDSTSGYLFVDYPGYGRCEGKASPEGITRNSEGAFETLRRRLGMDSPSHEKTSPGPGLHLLGHSLGAAAALQFAERRPVERVILLAPFTTMRAMAELVVGRWLAGLLRHNFDNPACLRELQKRSPKPRVIIFHGREDTVVPVWMGRTLAAGAPEMVTLKEVAGAGHNDLLALCGHELGTAMKR